MLKLSARFTLATLTLLALSTGLHSEENKPLADLRPLGPVVKKIVEKYFPGATVNVEQGRISFESNTRKFMVHLPTLTGEWQDATEVIGPRKKGIWGQILAQPGPYQGMASVPQTLDRLYFKVWLSAPSSKELDMHLWTTVSTPPREGDEFVAELNKALADFPKVLGK